jgi:hypothetical protein
MGDSPFTDPTVPAEVTLGEDTETDIRISRRKLDVVIVRLKDAANTIRDNPAMASRCKLFGTDGLAFVNRVTTRLEAVAYELTAAGLKWRRYSIARLALPVAACKFSLAGRPA